MLGTTTASPEEGLSGLVASRRDIWSKRLPHGNPSFSIGTTAATSSNVNASDTGKNKRHSAGGTRTRALFTAVTNTPAAPAIPAAAPVAISLAFAVPSGLVAVPADPSIKRVSLVATRKLELAEHNAKRQRRNTEIVLGAASPAVVPFTETTSSTEQLGIVASRRYQLKRRSDRTGYPEDIDQEENSHANNNNNDDDASQMRRNKLFEF